MKAYKKLESIFEKLAYFEHLGAITNWDEAVMMPSGGGTIRAKALAALRNLTHETLTNPEVGELIEKAKDESLSSPWQKANLGLMERFYRHETCLPASLVNQITLAMMRSQQAWRTLRAENNWHDFAPLLENILLLTKESAQIRSEILNLSPYDVLLDDFIPGIKQQNIDPIFSVLKKSLPDLIQQIIAKQKHRPHIAIKGRFPAEQQKQIGLELMQAIGFDFNHGRLDVSHHPFCGGDPEDVRITTRYNENEFITSAMAICHETGHALYEQNLPHDWLRQPVGRIHSMAMHESQSLLIEMQACRSREFMNFLSPLIIRTFGDDEAFSADNLYASYTTVKPDFIRVDADEVTYPLHVILRYELEKQLIAGDISVYDLPEAWDAAMKHYLGLSTKDDYKDGVMQDVHWPSGAFGYFPSYTLGSLTAAQMFASAKNAYPDILEELSHGNFTSLYKWLIENVHSKASSISFDQLMREATGESLDPNYFIAHIKQKYLSV